MASTTFSKEEREQHIKSIEKQVKYLEEAERELKTKMSKDEEKALKEEAKNLQKPVQLHRRLFNFMSASWSDERLKREAYSLRAQKRRAELLTSKNVQLVQNICNYGEIRVVLHGKSGKGKSSLGNNLLGYKNFTSETSLKGITMKCKYGVRYLSKEHKLLVVDTPGFFDSKKPNKEMSVEITKCIGLAAPGPNIFIFVVSTERFTPEEKDTLTNLQMLFGEKVIDYVIIVFTRKDSLSRRNGIMECMRDADDILLDLLVKCKFRFAFINNRSDPDDVSVDIDVILDLIFRTIGENNGAYYTNTDFGIVYKAFEIIIKNKEKKKKKKPQQLKEGKSKFQDEHQEDVGFNRASDSMGTEKESEREPHNLEEEKGKHPEDAGFKKEEAQILDVGATHPVNHEVNVNPCIEDGEIDEPIEEIQNTKLYYELKHEIEKDGKNEELKKALKKALDVNGGVAAGVAAGSAVVAGAPQVAAGAGVAAAAPWLKSWW